jgi:purine-binding chemotaxis protein CheW
VAEHLLYTIGNQTYAMPIEHVESIEKVMPITRIPLQSPEQLGVAVIRGEMVTAFDTALIMGVDNTYTNDDMLIITEGKRAFRVTEASDIVRIEPNEIQRVTGMQVWLHDDKAVPMVDLTTLKGAIDDGREAKEAV